MRSVPRRFLKNRTGGFTLVELLVTIAILGIATAAIGTVFVSGLASVQNTQRRFNEHSLALMLMQKVTRSVKNCTELALYDSADAAPAGGGGIRLFYSAADGLTTVGEDGVSTADLVDPGSGCDVAVTFRKAAAARLAVTVAVKTRGGPDSGYTLRSEIQLDNLSGSAGGQIADHTSDPGSGGALALYRPYRPPVESGGAPSA